MNGLTNRASSRRSSRADALACWNSDLYQAAKAKQRGGVEAEILVIEGYDGPQPSASEPPPEAGPASE